MVINVIDDGPGIVKTHTILWIHMVSVYLERLYTSQPYFIVSLAPPELEGKDVEDLFTAVLSPSTSHPPPQLPHHQGPGPLPATPGTSMPHPNAGTLPIIL